VDVILVKRAHLVALAVVVTACAAGSVAAVLCYARYVHSERFATDVARTLSDALGTDVRVTGARTPAPHQCVAEDVTVLSHGAGEVLADGLEVSFSTGEEVESIEIRRGTVYLSDTNISEWLRCFAPATNGKMIEADWERATALVSWPGREFSFDHLTGRITACAKGIRELSFTAGDSQLDAFSLYARSGGALRTVEGHVSLAELDLARSAVPAALGDPGKIEAHQVEVDFTVGQPRAEITAGGAARFMLVAEECPADFPLIIRAQIEVQIKDVLLVGGALKRAKVLLHLPDGRKQALATPALVQWMSYVMAGYWPAVPHAVGPMKMSELGLVITYDNGTVRFEGDLDEFGNWIILDEDEVLQEWADAFDHPMRSEDLPLKLVIERIVQIRVLKTLGDRSYPVRSFPDRGLAALAEVFLGASTGVDAPR